MVYLYIRQIDLQLLLVFDRYKEGGEPEIKLLTVEYK